MTTRAIGLARFPDVVGVGRTIVLAEASPLLDELGLGELKRLFGLVRKQYDPILSHRMRICLVGPVNTGKSSLYNALVGTSEPRAEVSPVPGTTRRSQTGDAEVFWVIDTPGATEMVVGEEGPRAAVERHEEAIDAALHADFLIIVFDAPHGVAQDELTIFDDLTSVGKPFVVALNKIDLIRREDRDKVVQAAARTLQLDPQRVIPTSATRRINLNLLVLAALREDPRLLSTLSELVPGSRWMLANRTILGASVAAGTANLITSPFTIPLASFVPITSIQVGMVLSLARIFGFRLGLARAREIAATLGSGLLARSLFYQLVNLMPVAGWALGTAIAAGTTMAVGYSGAAWFARGERPTKEAIRSLTESLTRALAESLRGFSDKRSLKENLESAVQQAFWRVREPGAPEEAARQD